jgi:alanine dehydrogenase
MAIATKGWRQAVRDDPALARGLNLCDGKATHPAVAEALGLPYISVERIIP